MTIKEVLQKAGEIGDFPIVQVCVSVNSHRNTKGKITSIKPGGISVDLGEKWDKWFHVVDGTDNRSNYMYQLDFVTQ